MAVTMTDLLSASGIASLGHFHTADTAIAQKDGQFIHLILCLLLIQYLHQLLLDKVRYQSHTGHAEEDGKYNHARTLALHQVVELIALRSCIGIGIGATISAGSTFLAPL